METDQEVYVEYAQEYTSGDMHLLAYDKLYPIDKRIQRIMKFGGRVYKREIIVVSDWEEVE
jgi:hypothetical protein